MSLLSWLKPDYTSPIPPNPELAQAIQRYKNHFGKFDLNTTCFYSSKEIIETIDLCIEMNKSFWEWHGRDPDVIDY